MSLFFTSDTHFGHGNIIKYCKRPFLGASDLRELEIRGGSWHDGNWKGTRSSTWRMSDEAVRLMDDTLINNINAMVGVNDTLWHLGDFAFGPRDLYYRRCREYRDRIRCRNVNIIWGNHDKRNAIRDLFNEAYGEHEIHVDGVQICMYHYASVVWNKSHRRAWQLYGHSHGGAEKWMDEHMPGRRSVDVGVDNANVLLGDYRPFSFDELRNLFSGRTGFSMDHHIDPDAPTEETLVG